MTDSGTHIRLRAHHVDTLSYLDGIWSRNFLGIEYGKKFVENMEALKNRITPDTYIEIVSGLDDMCINFGCPRVEYCRAGDYEAWRRDVIKRIEESDLIPVFKEVLKKNVIKSESPEALDAEAIERYYLKNIIDRGPILKFESIKRF
ncbi:MAG: DUF1284 domain-containing protein [Candidatus Aenigmatarchaeota archaeon]